MILARAEVSAASPADLVPASDLAGVAHLDDEPCPSIAGGNQRPRRGPGRAARALDSASDTRSASVSWAEEGVRVQVDDGELEADACVIAVPASVIDELDFDPALPARQASALAAIAYGHAAKLFVPLRAATGAERGALSARALLGVDRDGRRRAGSSRSSARSRARPPRWSGWGSPTGRSAGWPRSAPACRSGARAERRRSLDLERRPVGAGGLLGRSARRRPTAILAEPARPAGFRGGAHRRGLPVVDGGRAAKRSASGPRGCSRRSSRRASRREGA